MRAALACSLCVSVLAARAVTAQEEVVVIPEGDTGAPPRRMELTVNGYLDERLTFQRVRTGGLIPGDDVAGFVNLTEGNFQIKPRWGDRAFALADASFFFQKAAHFPGPAHDVAAYHPLAAISELYGSFAFSDHAQLTLGKKRIVWGPGVVANPTDLLDPPKDPTDPTLQRAGAWLARFEMPFERFTLSLVGAAKALREYGGVPTALLVYPGYDAADDGAAHFATAARLYALVADTDVNLEYFFTNLYNDAFQHKSRIGLSLSRLVGKSLEVHVEALGQLGSTRLHIDPACVVDAAAALTCSMERRLVARTEQGSRTPHLRGLLGARYTFGDDSMLGAEYTLYTDGYDGNEWRTLLTALALARDAGRAPQALFSPTATTDATAPQRFVFEPLRRHYLFLFFTKPRIRDDFTLNVTVIGALEDLSGQVAPQLTWSAREWLNVTLHLFAPIPAVAPTRVDGEAHGELGLAPADYRAVLGARMFY